MDKKPKRLNKRRINRCTLRAVHSPRGRTRRRAIARLAKLKR